MSPAIVIKSTLLIQTVEAPISIRIHGGCLMSRSDRLKIYKEHTKLSGIKYNHRQVYPQFTGKKRLSPAPDKQRKQYFAKFVSLYVPEHKPLSTLDKKDIRDGFGKAIAGGLNRKSAGFIFLKSFACTDFGSSVVKEIVNHPKTYRGFEILQGVTNQTQAVYGGFIFGKQFPTDRFKYGKQYVLPEAIIYHEFGHTMVFIAKNTKYHGHRDLQHEREVVIKLENPARVIHGGLEPRYTYTERMPGKPIKTINIVTGKEVSGAFTVHRKDPRIFMKSNHKDALKV